MPAPTRVQLGRMCLDLGDAEAAGRVVASLPLPGDRADGGVPRHVLESELLRRSAHYPEAQAAATRAVRLAPGSAPAQRALARANSALAVRTPGWRPSLGGGGVTGPGTRGRILHVVSNALPEQQTGYTLRTQAVARCQLRGRSRPLGGHPARGREGARRGRRRRGPGGPQAPRCGSDRAGRPPAQEQAAARRRRRLGGAGRLGGERRGAAHRARRAGRWTGWSTAPSRPAPKRTASPIAA